MSVESLTRATLDALTPRMTASVLVAYADTYFGSRLFGQLKNENSGGKMKQRYKLFACMWEKDNAQMTFSEDVATVTTGIVATEDTAADENIEDNSSMLKKSQSETQSVLPPCTHTNTANPPDSVQSTSLHVFWRGDVVTLRRVILEVDYIVMELRQAQDVFDMMHVLGAKELQRPKRVIVVSSLLTWYATPPLQSGTVEENATDDMDKNNEEEEEEEKEEEPRQLEKKEVEAILGRIEVRGGGNNNEDAEEEYAVELFTEDQYNRRIPHAKYYNWREAERVVAAGNSDERRIRTCVVFSGLQYGEGEDALGPFFAQAWNREAKGLPVYGDGTQLVPTVHVRDLVTFTRRLLEAETPPALPYVFATDCGISNWKRIVDGINHAFGREKTFYVPPGEFVLYNHVEHFTLNMRVDNQTMQDLMPADEDWVARRGFVNCMEKVALEYVEAYSLQPIRLVVLGPPLSGKTFLATALARRHYNLPTFTMEQVIEEYKAHIATLKERLTHFRCRLFETEKSRREEAKKRAFLRSRWAGGAAKGEEDEENEEAALGEEAKEDAEQQKVDTSSANNADNVVGENVTDFSLTEKEKSEVDLLVEEWYQQNDRVTQLRDTIASMERVLTMKVRLQSASNAESPGSSNPKKKKELTKSKRAGRLANKKTTEDEDVSNEVQENAPFRDKALALMMRWRLSCADCRNQGYVLDGFPETVAQARFVFSNEPLDVPDVVEETPVVASSSNAAAAPPDMNVAPPTTELCDEARLPSFVFVLNAADNFLLDRLTAVSKTLNEPPGTEEKSLARFEEAMTLHRRQFCDTDYSLANYFECARTVAGALTPGGRGVTVTTLRVDGEPLLAPPPPESEFAVAPPGPLELQICQAVGRPHNFGPTPQQQYDEVVRENNLRHEQRQKQVQVLVQQEELERLEQVGESEQRLLTESARREIELADRNFLEQRKAPLRRYLQLNVVPLLSKGLVEVCKLRPEDPVDFLAEWLIRHNPLDDSCFEL